MSRTSRKPRIIVGSLPAAGLGGLVAAAFVGLVAGSVIGVFLAGMLQESSAEGAATPSPELLDARDALARVRQDLAIAQRGSQVTEAANEVLRREVASMEERIAGLEADVAFYRRLLGSGGSQKGLAVHALQLEQASAPGVYRYQLTLSQNLNRAKIVSGEYELEAEGLLMGQMTRLDSEELNVLAREGKSGFEFKYFQELEGSFQFPDAFVPENLVVRLRAEGSETPIVRHFEWRELSAEPELGDTDGDVQSEG